MKDAWLVWGALHTQPSAMRRPPAKCRRSVAVPRLSAVRSGLGRSVAAIDVQSIAAPDADDAHVLVVVVTTELQHPHRGTLAPRVDGSPMPCCSGYCPGSCVTGAQPSLGRRV